MVFINYLLCAMLLQHASTNSILQIVEKTNYTLPMLPDLQYQDLEHRSNFWNDFEEYPNYEDPLAPIYITPDNIDEVLQSLSLPSMHTLKERKKPFSIEVEGIVGTGKTTLLTAFKVFHFI